MKKEMLGKDVEMQVDTHQGFSELFECTNNKHMALWIRIIITCIAQCERRGVGEEKERERQKKTRGRKLPQLLAVSGNG